MLWVQGDPCGPMTWGQLVAHWLADSPSTTFPCVGFTKVQLNLDSWSNRLDVTNQGVQVGHLVDSVAVDWVPLGLKTASFVPVSESLLSDPQNPGGIPYLDEIPA